MAGGVGSRFWPLSKQSYPKQFLDILSVGETLIQQTFRRLSLLCPKENIFIVTNKDYFDLCKTQLVGIKDSFM
jgi:mannose-1-phosphate guanylyltransferase